MESKFLILYSKYNFGNKNYSVILETTSKGWKENRFPNVVCVRCFDGIL